MPMKRFSIFSIYFLLAFKSRSTVSPLERDADVGAARGGLVAVCMDSSQWAAIDAAVPVNPFSARIGCGPC